MDEMQSRLLKCFAAVFPSAREEQLLHATVETLDNWDSIASATLLAVLEEEFGTEIDLEAFAELQSFEEILSYMRSICIL